MTYSQSARRRRAASSSISQRKLSGFAPENANIDRFRRALGEATGRRGDDLTDDDVYQMLYQCVEAYAALGMVIQRQQARGIRVDRAGVHDSLLN